MLFDYCRNKCLDLASKLVQAWNENEVENRIMRTVAFKWLLIANTLVGFGACALAQDIDVGKAEYRSSCAPCHGIDAKGDGSVADSLKTRPTDLTALAKNNNGVFP